MICEVKTYNSFLHHLCLVHEDDAGTCNSKHVIAKYFRLLLLSKSQKLSYTNKNQHHYFPPIAVDEAHHRLGTRYTVLED